MHVHLSNGSLHSSVAYLDCNYGVEAANGGLEWDEGRILVGKDAEEAVLNAHGDTGGYGLLNWHEPVFLLSALI